MTGIEFLEWDSRNFGFKVGQFPVGNIEDYSANILLSEAKKGGYRLVYIIAPQKLNNSTLFYDEKLLYSKIDINQDKITYGEIESYKSVRLTSDLYQLSISSGEFSRYNLDPRFPPPLFEMLYRIWIENSVNTDFATDVLVYRYDSKIAGLLTYKTKKSTSVIGIIAVNPLYKRLGIGSKLIQNYESVLNSDVVEINVATQGVNRQARIFYEKNGYSIKTRKFIYHLWT